ncbi:AEC family transporter [Aestuariispira ectoiniformans]|uniref:AEC family transporter n=1 Tax=Aestuariispira ectoiniformans TaxID=2775080 RepID=UPI00223A9FE8|nr:AEC family transporter [Aestuariispira ectoiniformans]
MLSILSSLLPIFLLLVLGNILRRNDFPSLDFWAKVDKLVYWVLFPGLLLHKTSTTSLDGDFVAPYAISLIAAMVAAGILASAAALLLQKPREAASSVFQGAARHNTFIAFAVSEALFGSEGLFYAAIGTAVLVPFTNIACVTALILLHGKNNGKSLPRRLLRELIRNPLLIAIATGVTLNLTGIGPLPVIDDMAQIIGKAALPVALLNVGAALRIKAIRVGVASVLLSSFGKLCIFPAIAIGILLLTGLTGVPAYTIAIYATVPTAVSGYALANQLGGDAPLMAGIITIQTLISMATMPFALFFLFPLFSPG